MFSFKSQTISNTQKCELGILYLKFQKSDGKVSNNLHERLIAIRFAFWKITSQLRVGLEQVSLVRRTETNNEETQGWICISIPA